MLILYEQKGEKSKIDNAQPWVDLKKKGSEEAAKLLFANSESLRKQVEEGEKLKAAKAAKAAKQKAATPPPSATNNNDRKRSWQQAPNSATKKAKTVARPQKDKRTMYISKRVAKAFEQENDEGQVETEIFFGTIDRLANDKEPFLWHVQVSLTPTSQIACVYKHERPHRET
jgi:hypothetical protein